MINKTHLKTLIKETKRQDDVGQLITEFINDNLGEYNTRYNNGSYDLSQDLYIEYHVEKSSIWESDSSNFKYEGTVYIIVDRLLIGSKDKNTWERMYEIDDIPDFIMDDFQETIYIQVKKYFEADIDFDIYMYTGPYLSESVLKESKLPDGLSDLLFDIIDDYKDSCDFFEDDLDFAEAIINYTISRGVSKDIIEPISDEYIQGLSSDLFERYGETLMDEYVVICKNID